MRSASLIHRLCQALILISSLQWRPYSHQANAFSTSPRRKPSCRFSLEKSSIRQSSWHLSPVASISQSSTSLKMIWKVKEPKGVAVDFPQTKTRLLTTVIAALATWHSISVNRMHPVLASAATTLALSMWSPGLGQAAFCGSFAGMSSVGSLASTLTTGAITAGLFEYIVHRENKWVGLGGRLGFIAFLATNLTAYIFGKPHPMLSIPTGLGEWRSILQASPALYAMGCAAIGSVATIVLRELAEYATNDDNDMQDPVRAASVIGIVSSLVVGVGNVVDPFGSLLVYGGAFTGMSLPSRLIKGSVSDISKRSPPGAVAIVTWYAIAGALGGLIHALTVPLNWWTGGVWGGKAGTCAFAGVALFRILENIVYIVRERVARA